MDLKSKIILISGPTASGKSNFSIKLAKKVNGEIINADSMQVYKELKILSARPSPKDYQKIKHHLYGFHSVKKNFSTGDWLKIAIKKVKEIKKRKKIPIFVGGTGLYFKALTDGLVSIPNIPIRYRNNIRDLQKKLGQKKFYQKLLKLDPKSKDKINPTDTQRSIRAYEVKQFTKKSLHEWFENTKSYFDKGDPYHCYCHKTTRLISEKFSSIKIKTTFQSRFGPQEWLQPYTDKTLENLPKEGIKNILTICPGFSSDCVETLEEILIQGKDSFLKSGGENFDMVPCLNDNDDHIVLLKSLIEKNI